MALGGEHKRRISQGGVALAYDGHRKAHELQTDDGQTQTSVSWAGRPSLPSPYPRSPLPPSRQQVTVATKTAGAAAE